MENKRTDYFREYMSTYRKEKKETVHKAQKNWREKNREYQKLYMREYRAKKKAEKLAKEMA
ncbi:hypothetical protein N2W44_002889 [Clostridium perfringens]|uniref:Phage protein n=1 Tax=Clostridium perfringens TaxID=1502 RepID=A0AAW9KIG4_CLOPF|nr:hypothetical protein [Clostridium sp.]EJT6475627.1 hypothetical protein [Clostridium perfringens]EJT6481235.1 hypothetical protein [Clostridium perfringens]EJT6532686.1 hypothetical protein [Clostridium perfringens]MBS5940094.1 hypothetical protein [Clostridium sp.]MDM0630731.1 hypothetical protein [Clostridium perfringens]